MLRILRWLFFGTDEHLSSIKERLDEAESKIRTFERDLQDLDQRYRRLRALGAAETRHSTVPPVDRSPLSDHPGETGEPVSGTPTKAELRARAAALLRKPGVLASGS